MNAKDWVFLGLKKRVAALRKSDGQIVWVTELPGGMGDNFISITCDEKCLYAHTQGSIHCLDLESGKVLWSNGLEGYGYGVATICLHGYLPSPASATYETIRSSQGAGDGGAVISTS